MKLLAAFHQRKLKAPTGGQYYDLQFFEALQKVVEVEAADVRYRWILTHLHAFAWLLRYRCDLEQADWVVQTASSPHSSALLISMLRFFYPHLRHLGIVHHPRSLETPRRAVAECRFYNRFDALLAISEHIRQQLQAEGIRPDIDVLPPGFDRVSFLPDAKESPPLIVWNGHLLSRKGPQVLLDALKLLTTEQYRAIFLAATEPDPDFATPFRAATIGANKRGVRAEIKSRLPRSEYGEHLRRASIFCLPSTIEGYSIATVEAMSAGCAVVVPKTANFIELLGNEQYPGFFPPNDPAALARLLDKLLQDRQALDALMSFCRARAEALPSWQEFRVNVQQFAKKRLLPERECKSSK